MSIEEPTTKPEELELKHVLHQLLGILGRFTQYKMKMDEAIQEDDVVWWVDSGAKVHVCKDRCLFNTYESLNDGSILHIENESTTMVHERGCVDLMFSSGMIVSLFNVLHVPNIRKNLVSSTFMSTSKLDDSILWRARLGHVHFKRMQDMSKDGLIPAFNMDTESGCRVVVRLPDPKLKILGERGIECIFVGYVKYPKAFKFFAIKPNKSVLINSIIESNDFIFNENRFSLVPRPSLSIPKGTEYINGSVVPKKVTEEVVQQSEHELRKSKRNKTPKDFGPEFQLYLIEGTRDEVSDQHFYYFNVEDDPKIFDEVKKSQDVAYGKKQLMMRWIPSWATTLRQKSRIDYFDTYAPVARISTIRLLIAMASIHNLIIHHMDVKTAFLNVLEGYTDASWISNTKDNSSTSGWVFLLGGGAISWESKKQTCITGSTMESKFVALAAADKEAKWLRNMIFEIPL
nr:hypothetical protein [Tanacetum cinerariifolium]